MKPLKLTLNAFGSYADLQTIDFAALGKNGLYLITGETGSGKTTIFDAISFALFGKASGSSRGDYTMLRSDFAGGNDKTFVELDFASGNNVYNIKRIIRKTGQDVALSLPDGTLVSGDRNVKAKVYETVGLDRDQFAQIVMIAQNDFLRFLQSGTDDRVKILRRIFGTEMLKDFQERLKARAKLENEKRERVIYDFERHGVDVYKRNEQFAEWESQAKADKADVSKADAGLGEYDKAKQKLAAELALAEDLCGKFSDLAAFRVSLEKHEAKAGDVEKYRNRAALGETALRKVKPLADESARTLANHANAKTGLAAAEKQEAAALKELELAETAVRELPPLAESQNALAVLSKKWEAAVEQLKKLTSLQMDLAVITGKQNALSRMQSEFEVLNAGFADADGKYRLLENAFFQSQAGILAAGLVDGKPCPVCGSATHPGPATLSDGDVTEAELKKAKDAKDRMREKRETQSMECGNAAMEIKTLSARFANDFSEFVPGAESETPKANPTQLLDRLLDGTKRETDALTAEKKAAEKSLAELGANRETATGRKSNAESSHKSSQTLVAERNANEREASRLCMDAQAGYREALQTHGFSGEAEYLAALVTEHELADMARRLADYDRNGEQLARDIKRLESETTGKAPPDLETLKIKADTANAESAALGKRREETKSRLDRTETRLKELRRAAIDFEQADKSYAAVKQLSDTANGKLDFETYAQMAYFERVLLAANQRLKVMSHNRYTLQRKQESSDGRSKTGLEIETFDAYTGKARSANSLSGGESFMASLSLALGLSDVVQQSAGGIRLDAMFIDEGFGTLDTETLDVAIKTLSEMAGTDRIVGIISHVAELRERVDRQIRIEKTTGGSRITMLA
ncbi:MAG: SMC family ATPase [Treponema sp.]|nr:SMC family ATPase [Treponema sp.]